MAVAELAAVDDIIIMAACSLTVRTNQCTKGDGGRAGHTIEDTGVQILEEALRRHHPVHCHPEPISNDLQEEHRDIQCLRLKIINLR